MDVLEQFKAATTAKLVAQAALVARMDERAFDAAIETIRQWDGQMEAIRGNSSPVAIDYGPEYNIEFLVIPHGKGYEEMSKEAASVVDLRFLKP